MGGHDEPGVTTEQLRLMVDFMREANEVEPRHIERLRRAAESRPHETDPRAARMVARRRRLPDLPALVPGLRRRRGRRPPRDRSHDSTTSSGSASTRSGSRRSIRRRSPTPATTSPTTPRSTRPTAPRRLRRADRRLPRAGSGCCSTWSPRTPRSSTLVPRAPRLVRVGRRRAAQQLARGVRGPAWSRDERSGRWYLHSFYPEQPDLDWRNPEVRRRSAP